MKPFLELLLLYVKLARAIAIGYHILPTIFNIWCTSWQAGEGVIMIGVVTQIAILASTLAIVVSIGQLRWEVRITWVSLAVVLVWVGAAGEFLWGSRPPRPGESVRSISHRMEHRGAALGREGDARTKFLDTCFGHLVLYYVSSEGGVVRNVYAVPDYALK